MKELNKFTKYKKNEINCFLSGENDDYDIYRKFMQAQGAQKGRWADMLRRMYIKY